MHIKLIMYLLVADPFLCFFTIEYSKLWHCTCNPLPLSGRSRANTSESAEVAIQQGCSTYQGIMMSMSMTSSASGQFTSRIVHRTVCMSRVLQMCKSCLVPADSSVHTPYSRNISDWTSQLQYPCAGALTRALAPYIIYIAGNIYISSKAFVHRVQERGT